MMRHALVLSAFCFVVSGCSDETPVEGPKLTADTAGQADAGKTDSGRATDTGGTTTKDAGSTTSNDVGPTTNDSGPTATDTGATTPDSGATTDTGSTATDSGTATPDTATGDDVTTAGDTSGTVDADETADAGEEADTSKATDTSSTADAGVAADTGTAACTKATDCSDNNPCTFDTCQKGACVHTNNTANCDDGNPCTTGDACADGTCKGGKAKDCDDGDKCTDDSCNKTSGDCEHDGIIGCAGYCKDDKSCDDGNACTTDACTNGKCTMTPKTGACDDGKACTIGSACKNGACATADVVVSTLAGTNAWGFKDDVGAKVKMNRPAGMIWYSDNLLFADMYNHSIRKALVKSGTVGLMAGVGGKPGYVDGPQKTARFNYPADVAIDGKNIVYVADRSNHRIRAINKVKVGHVSTFAGIGAGFTNGPADKARFNNPYGLASTKAGVLYVADCSNNRVRLIKDGIVSTFAGGSAGFKDGTGINANFRCPVSIALDGEGTLFVADHSNHALRRISPNAVVTTLAGTGKVGSLDGNAKTAQLNYPWGIDLDASGRLFFADRSNHKVRMLVGGVVSTIAGTGSAGNTEGSALDARFNGPLGVVVDPQGRVWVSDHWNHRIRLAWRNKGGCEIGGTCYAAATVAKNGCATCDAAKSAKAWTNTKASSPCTDGKGCSAGDGCDGSGTCSAKPKNCDDKDACTIDSCDADTGACIHKSKPGCSGKCLNDADCKSDGPCALPGKCLGGKCATGGAIGVTTLVGIGAGFKDGASNVARLRDPRGIEVDSKGVTWIADFRNHRLRTWDGKTLKTVAGNGVAGFKDGTATLGQLYYPADVAIGKAGVYVADTHTQRIRLLSGGKLSTVAGLYGGFADGKGATARFNQPYGIVATGGGTLFVADRYNHRIRRVTLDGNVTTVAGSGKAGHNNGKASDAQFREPIGIDADAQGNLFVADHRNHRIRRVTQAGVVTDVAGSGTPGHVDGDPAKARLHYPSAVVFGPAGTLFVADTSNHRIRTIVGGKIGTYAGTGISGHVNGSAVTARFSNPTGLAIDGYGNLVVADYSNNRIRQIRSAIGACFIGGRCWSAGVTKPGDACASCAGGAAKWTATGDGQPCDDGALCTTADTCKKAGGKVQCSGKKTACDDKDKCTTDACDTGTGLCAYKPIVGCGGNCAADKDCDDGNPCTVGHSCQAGKCKDTSGAVVISTTAGSGKAGYKDGKGTAAVFRNVMGIAFGATGTVWIADSGNHRIRKMAADGTVTSVTGIGKASFADGPASKAAFHWPADLAAAPDGSVWVADRSNSRIRRVAKDGSVTTIAGQSGGFANGKGSTARFNNPYGIDITKGGVAVVADHYNNRVRRITADGTVSTLAGGKYDFKDGKGASAAFRRPLGIALDGEGNAFVADHLNHAIRRVAPDGTVTTVAGTGKPGYLDGPGKNARMHYPWGVATDSGGRVYFVDRNNHRVRRIDRSGNVSALIGSIAGYVEGTAATARISGPTGIAVDARGRVLISDYNNHRLRWITDGRKACNIDGGCYSDGSANNFNGCQVCNGAKAPKAWTEVPDGTACGDGNPCTVKGSCAVGVCNGTAVKCDDGDKCTKDACGGAGVCTFTKIIGCNGYCEKTSDCDDGNACTNGHACVGNTCQPAALSMTSWVAGTGNASWADGAAAKAKFHYPYDVAFDGKGTTYIADQTNHRVRKLASGAVTTLAGSGKPGLKDGKATAAGFYNPQGINVAADGVVWVADTSNHALRTVASDGTVTTVAGTGAGGFLDGDADKARLNAPTSLVFAKDGSLFWTDYGNHRVRKLAKVKGKWIASTFAGSSAGTVDGKGTKARFRNPSALAIGPKGAIYVVEYYGHALRKVATDGTVTTLIGGKGPGAFDGPLAKASLQYPRGVAVDAAGTIFVSDRYNHRIRRIKGGTVDTYAGGAYGYLDGGDSISRFRYPNGIKVDATGTLWVADGHNHRIRKVAPSAGACMVKGMCYAAGINGCK